MRTTLFWIGSACLVWAVGTLVATRLGTARLSASETVAGFIPLTEIPAIPALKMPSVDSAPLHARPAAKKKTQQVTVRLFSESKVTSLSIESDHGLYWKDRRFTGVMTLSIDGDRVVMRQGSRRLTRTQRVELLVPEGAFDIHRPHGAGRRTTGILEVTIRRNELLVVNHVDLETYVLGIVEPELGSLSLPAEAMKAQIVAARSYFLAVSNRHPGQSYEFCDGPHCQVYAGIGHYPKRFLEAAQAVRGLYLTYHGRPAAAFFHHSCGGTTAAIEDIWPGPAIPYLRSVVDGSPTAYCHLAPHNDWTIRITRHALRNCFARQGWIRNGEALDSLRVIRRNKSGRADQILVQSSQPRWVRADLFCHTVNRAFNGEVLFSTDFQIYAEGNYFRFEGRGWGHGVGMCQSGAIVMARHGKKYTEILSHYFPGTNISRLPNHPYAPQPDPSFLHYLRNLVE